MPIRNNWIVSEMIFVFVFLIIAAVSLVVYALIRGLHAFVDPSRITDKSDSSKSYSTQNKMMFARVKWQAVVVVIIVILMYVVGF